MTISEKVIMVLHSLFILFIIITPFIKSDYFTLIHAIIIPFIVFHWIVNNNTCSVVFVEKKINRLVFGYDKDYRGFFANLIEPVYDFKKNHNEYALCIYGITIALWLVSVYKIYQRYEQGKIKSLKDLLCVTS